MKHLATVLILGMAAMALLADDWPQWRGPNRDNILHETGLLETFPPEGLKFLWRVEVGYGYSSPVVADGRVFVTDSQLTQPKAREGIHCFDQATGEKLWSHEYEVDYPDWVFTEAGHRGPTPTPIVRDGRLYALQGSGELFCFKAASGRIIWQKNVHEAYESQVGEFGTDASPLIEGDLLILLLSGKPDASLVALDKHTGAEVWRAVDARRPYSSPFVITTGNTKQLIVWTQKEVISLNPLTGKAWWTLHNPIRDYSVATPVYGDGLLLIGGLMLKVEGDPPAATVLWPDRITQRVLSNTSTPLLAGGYVYSARSHGQLVCLDAATGKQVWETEKVTDILSGASIHITPIGDRVLIFNDRGELILARLSPAGYEEFGRALLIKPTYPFGGRNVTWVPPAYANRCVFARTDKELVCASLAAK